MRFSMCIVLPLILLLTACNSKFSGYRGTPQTPAQILAGGDALDEQEYPELTQAETLLPPARPQVPPQPTPTSPNTPPVVLSQKAPEPPRTVAVAPTHTAMPLQPTEFRRVWVAPHVNKFGDAVHGHFCEILFAQAKFTRDPKSADPPTAPVIIHKEQIKTPRAAPARAAPADFPRDLQQYLHQLGIPDGRRPVP